MNQRSDEQILSLIVLAIKESTDRDLSLFSVDELLLTSLYGIEAVIDSIHLIHFLVALEGAIEKKWNKKVSLFQSLLKEELIPLSSLALFLTFLQRELYD